MPPGMEAPLLIGPGYEQGRRSRGHPQDVTARSRQVHVSRIANSPFRVVSAGSAPRGALPPADGARAIPRPETIAHTVGKSPRRVITRDFAPRAVAWRRSVVSGPVDAHDAFLLDVSVSGRPGWAGAPRSAQTGPAPAAVRSAAGRDMPAGSGPCRDGPVNTASIRGQSRARSQVTAASTAASAAPRIGPCAMPGHPFPRQEDHLAFPFSSGNSRNASESGRYSHNQLAT